MEKEVRQTFKRNRQRIVSVETRTILKPHDKVRVAKDTQGRLIAVPANKQIKTSSAKEMKEVKRQDKLGKKRKLSGAAKRAAEKVKLPKIRGIRIQTRPGFAEGSAGMPGYEEVDPPRIRPYRK